MAPEGSSIDPIFSVSEFIEYANVVIGRRPVTVEGEISGFTVNQGKWVFFDLKDAQGKVGCFALLYQLATQLEDGMQVQVTGVPRIYPKTGKFSLHVSRIELVGTGSLRRAFQLTKIKLESEGIFDPTRKRELPAFPQKIGLICSRESAAYSDFMRILLARWGRIEVVLYHVNVQGESSVREIGKAFQWFNDHPKSADILVLIRGGGSLEDLQAFNSESVARAVFGSHIPVVCGVGHERDESLADYAADVRAATPTHAATLVVPDQAEVCAAIDSSVTALTRSFEYALEWHAQSIQSTVAVLQSSLHQHTLGFQALAHSLVRLSDQILHTVYTKHEICTLAQSHLSEYMDSSIESRKKNLSFMERNIVQMNPLTVLKRGYTIVRKGGSIVDRIGTLKKDDHIAIQFSDGDMHAEII